MWVIHVTYHTGANVDITPDIVPSLTANDVKTLEYGSKLVIASWYTYTGSICMFCRNVDRDHYSQDIYRDLKVYGAPLLSTVDVWRNTQAKNTEITFLGLRRIVHPHMYYSDIWLSPVSSHAPFQEGRSYE